MVVITPEVIEGEFESWRNLSSLFNPANNKCSQRHQPQSQLPLELELELEEGEIGEEEEKSENPENDIVDVDKSLSFPFSQFISLLKSTTKILLNGDWLNDKKCSKEVKERLKIVLESVVESIDNSNVKFSKYSSFVKILHHIISLVFSPWPSGGLMSNKISVSDIHLEYARDIWTKEGPILLEIRIENLCLAKITDLALKWTKVAFLIGHDIYGQSKSESENEEKTFEIAKDNDNLIKINENSKILKNEVDVEHLEDLEESCKNKSAESESECDIYFCSPDFYERIRELFFFLLFLNKIESSEVDRWLTNTIALKVSKRLLSEEEETKNSRIAATWKTWRGKKSETKKAAKDLLLKSCKKSLLRDGEDLETLKDIYHAYLNLMEDEDGKIGFIRNILKDIASVKSIDYIYALAETILEKCEKNEETKKHFMEIYIRAMMEDYSKLEALYHQDQENPGESENPGNPGSESELVKNLQSKLSARYIFLGEHFREFPKTAWQFKLTAFSLSPTESLFKELFPDPEGGGEEEEKENSQNLISNKISQISGNSENCVKIKIEPCDSSDPPPGPPDLPVSLVINENIIKIENDLPPPPPPTITDNKVPDAGADLPEPDPNDISLSSALNESLKFGLPTWVCLDLQTIMFNARLKHLYWADKEELRMRCKNHLEAKGATKLKRRKEDLTHLNIDYDQFKFKKELEVDVDEEVEMEEYDEEDEVFERGYGPNCKARKSVEDRRKILTTKYNNKGGGGGGNCTDVKLSIKEKNKLKIKRKLGGGKNPIKIPGMPYSYNHHHIQNFQYYPDFITTTTDKFSTTKKMNYKKRINNKTGELLASSIKTSVKNKMGRVNNLEYGQYLGGQGQGQGGGHFGRGRPLKKPSIEPLPLRNSSASSTMEFYLDNLKILKRNPQMRILDEDFSYKISLPKYFGHDEERLAQIRGISGNGAGAGGKRTKKREKEDEEVNLEDFHNFQCVSKLLKNNLLKTSKTEDGDGFGSKCVKSAPDFDLLSYRPQKISRNSSSRDSRTQIFKFIRSKVQDSPEERAENMRKRKIKEDLENERRKRMKMENPPPPPHPNKIKIIKNNKIIKNDCFARKTRINDSINKVINKTETIIKNNNKRGRSTKDNGIFKVPPLPRRIVRNYPSRAPLALPPPPPPRPQNLPQTPPPGKKSEEVGVRRSERIKTIVHPNYTNPYTNQNFEDFVDEDQSWNRVQKESSSNYYPEGSENSPGFPGQEFESYENIPDLMNLDAFINIPLEEMERFIIIQSQRQKQQQLQSLSQMKKEVKKEEEEMEEEEEDEDSEFSAGEGDTVEDEKEKEKEKNNTSTPPPKLVLEVLDNSNSEIPGENENAEDEKEKEKNNTPPPLLLEMLEENSKSEIPGVPGENVEEKEKMKVKEDSETSPGETVDDEKEKNNTPTSKLLLEVLELEDNSISEIPGENENVEDEKGKMEEGEKDSEIPAGENEAVGEIENAGENVEILEMEEEDLEVTGETVDEIEMEMEMEMEKMDEGDLEILAGETVAVEEEEKNTPPPPPRILLMEEEDFELIPPPVPEEEDDDDVIILEERLAWSLPHPPPRRILPLSNSSPPPRPNEDQNHDQDTPGSPSILDNNHNHNGDEEDEDEEEEEEEENKMPVLSPQSPIHIIFDSNINESIQNLPNLTSTHT